MPLRRRPGGEQPSDSTPDLSSSPSMSSGTSTPHRVSSEGNLGSLGMENTTSSSMGSTRSQPQSGHSSRKGSLSKARAMVEGLRSPMLGVMKLDEIRENFNKGVEVQ